MAKCWMVQNFDECFCLPVEHTTILLLLLLHALVAIVTTPCHVVHVYFVLDKHSEGVLCSE